MALTVRIGFDLSAIGDPTLFTLDDPTQGELDGIYVLGGTLFQDVTQYVRGVSVRRGRSRRLDKFQTGAATVTLDNTLRVFDPEYAGSPYAGQIQPRRPIQITDGVNYLFTGLIEDWNLDYSLNRDSIATALCVDGFTLLASSELAGFTASATLPGARISEILDRPEVSWPAGSRDLAPGSQQLQLDTVTAGIEALNYLQIVEETEAGALFVASDGVLTFRGSNTPSAAYADLVFTNGNEGVDTPYDSLTTGYDAPTVAYAFDAIPGTFVAFNEIGVEYGTETLHNRVVIGRANSATTAAADDTTSQAAYGVSTLSRTELLFASDDQLEGMAEYLVNRYGEPQVRIRTLGVDVRNSPVSTQLLALEFGDVVRVRFTPNGIGAPIDQYVTIEGIAHEVSPTRHQMTFQFERITYFPFELDSTDYGILNTNVLGL
jgi:hypothetical protein